MLKFLFDVFLQNYISWILVVTLAVIIRIDDNEKPEGTQWIRAIVGSLFILILLQSIEMIVIDILNNDHADYVNINIRTIIIFRYFKTFTEHALYCGIVLMQVLLMNSVKKEKQFLLFIPEFLVIVGDGLSCCGIPAVFSVDENGLWRSGPLNFLPYLTAFIYFALLAFYSWRMLGRGDKKKIMVLVLITMLTVVNGILEMMGIVTRYMDEIVGIDIMAYYIYFYSLHRAGMREEMYKQKMELEQSKNNLLVSQIRPHFIYNSLSVIRYLCYEDQDMAVETIDHFADYLRQSMQIMTDNKPVPFKTEMKLVDNYLYIEQKRFLDKITVVEKLKAKDFEIPLLTIQPIVENAIRHGIRSKKMRGTVTITSWEEQEHYVVEVEDDGSGFDVKEVGQERKEHIGLKNVEDRLQLMVGGSLQIESVLEKGTKVVIIIPKKRKMLNNPG